MSRASWKGPFLVKKFLRNFLVIKKIQLQKQTKFFAAYSSILVWSRRSVIPSAVLGRKIKIYTGYKFRHVSDVHAAMVGHKFGAFALSYQKKNYTKAKKSKK